MLAGNMLRCVCCLAFLGRAPHRSLGRGPEGVEREREESCSRVKRNKDGRLGEEKTGANRKGELERR